MLSKGKMIQILKQKGIRNGVRGNATMKLEHLKTPDVAKLYFIHCK